MKENADIDQNKLSFRNPAWILILGVEEHKRMKIPKPKCFTSRVHPRDSRVPLETGLIYLFLFTGIAVFVIK